LGGEEMSRADHEEAWKMVHDLEKQGEPLIKHLQENHDIRGLILFFDFLSFGPRGPLLDHFRGIAKKNRIRKNKIKPQSIDQPENLI
jgi:hypothetical protein